MKYIYTLFLILFTFNTITLNIYADETEQNYEQFGEMEALDFGEADIPCSEIIGEDLMTIIKIAMLFLRIGAVIFTVVKGMLTILPAVASSKPDELKKCISKFVEMLVVCAIICLLPTIVKVLGLLFGYDLSCII